jgi:hypothetical protein
MRESTESIDKSKRELEDEWLNFLSGTIFDEVMAKGFA